MTAPAPASRARPALSLAARLTVWYAAMAFLLVAGAGWVQYRTLASDLTAEDDQLLLETLAAARETGAAPASQAALPMAFGPIVRELDAACRDVRGAWSPDGPPPSCRPPSARSGSSGQAPAGVVLMTWDSPAGRTWRLAIGPTDPTTNRHLEVALDRWTDQRVLADYRRKMSAVLAAALVLASGLGYLVARRGLSPLRALARQMEAVDARSLDRRPIVPRAPAEVQALVSSFDAMLGRLEGAFAALTQFSAELAHELRTPIHVMRQQAEVALARARTPEEYREALGSGLEELERLRRLVDDTLFLARAEDPRSTVTRARLDAGAELAGVAEYLEAVAIEAGVTLATEVAAHLSVSADRTLFRRALVNLVTNAVRHTPPGGRVTLVARDRGDSVAVEVRDNGEGMSADAVARAFDRYYRGPHAVERGDGAGLGLAIVRSIMQLHGGSAAVQSTPGEGTSALLSFPSAGV